MIVPGAEAASLLRVPKPDSCLFFDGESFQSMPGRIVTEFLRVGRVETKQKQRR